jgi:hypothetical protein
MDDDAVCDSVLAAADCLPRRRERVPSQSALAAPAPRTFADRLGRHCGPVSSPIWHRSICRPERLSWQKFTG